MFFIVFLIFYKNNIASPKNSVNKNPCSALMTDEKSGIMSLIVKRLNSAIKIPDGICDIS